jgi:NADPH:quinone reductase
MKAICVTASRELEVRDVPTPAEPAPNHVVIDMAGSAINHGDKAFLKMPTAAGNPLALGQYPVWGASGAGRVVAIGAGVPQKYLGRNVAIYRSLSRSAESVGLWCERSHVPFTACLILPDHVRALDYCGSLVNVMTAHAFLEEVTDAGHQGVIATAGNSATGHALAALARKRKMSAILLVRTQSARDALRSAGVEHVIVTREGFETELGKLAGELNTTAVFDGVGGELLTNIVPALPMNSTVYVYGFLGAAAPLTLSTFHLMAKNLTIRRFSNFESATVKDPVKLDRALEVLETMIDDPMMLTTLGDGFRYDRIDEAMAYASSTGAKAVLMP